MRSFRQSFRYLELNGGLVESGPPLRLVLPPVARGYANAQVDDYGGRKRRDYLWRPGATLQLAARFSHPAGELVGTAGFGFWNAPVGDPSVPWPALPQATWFFYASAPSDLPLVWPGPGRGWFAATIDATRPAALALMPLAPLLLLLNQFPALRQRIWPAVRHRLQISHALLEQDMTAWHSYRLDWRPDGCDFLVDGWPVLQAPYSPRGPLGFVCWIDNQYMVATPAGRLRWGVRPVEEEQWVEIGDFVLRLSPKDWRLENGD
ncbi:MAG: hypothetical protein L0332_22115 [Chloroflexi bacterium]|nr:hypothetical protein [Chloroflexota bacterium]MCI0576492.1 hypothetical protein [Chloroflexota bacterium]MCI0650214.1 hypothetical protein [Chloroflexota bacterium]MCI0729392.1 hypothetical protein [Chloroflexota bacterium]